jgi:Ran GTPase-activating protein (RanGAP) involved in mRNA processing and transport
MEETPESYQNMPKSVIDRLLNRKTRYADVELNEETVERILHKAAADGGYDLDLSGALLEGDAPFFIADVISHYGYYKFAHVNLNKTHLTIRGFDALIDIVVCFPELKTLTVQGNNLPKEAGMSIAKILGSHATLQVLDLRENQLSDAGLAAISGAFTADLSNLNSSFSSSSTSNRQTHSHHNSNHSHNMSLSTPSSLSPTISLLTLTILDLSYNSIGDSGLLSLCRGLSHFAKSFRGIGRTSALQILRLSHNKIGDKAAVCFAQFLESYYCTGYFALEEINFSCNPIGPTGLIAILAAIQPVTSEDHSTLMKVSLDFCKPNISVLDEITRLLRPPSYSKYSTPSSAPLSSLLP